MLTVKDLKIEFYDHGKPEIGVENISFSVNPGEILGIVGESGSGKSITALTIAGLLSRSDIKTSGRIEFFDKELLTLKRSELRKLQGTDISMVFQDPLSSLNPVKKIGWQVEESLRVHNIKPDKEGVSEKQWLKERALKALEDAGLTESEKVYNMYPHELSGGMRQRAMIAAACISNPKLLICDEPTTALDVVTQGKIIDLLKKLNKEHNTAILFISHDLRVVNMLCDNIIVLKNGHIVENGSKDQIFNSPKDEYTKTLIEYSFMK